jgi:hypothetical protein
MEEKIMKQQSVNVDTRIKNFMKQKIAEYPELNEKYGPRVEVVQRGYLWEDLVSMFMKKGKAS